MEPRGDQRAPSGKQDFLSYDDELKKQMDRDGWSLLEGMRWTKRIVNSTRAPMPNGGQVVKRITRDANDGTFLEYLWVTPSTTKRKKAKALPKKMDVDVVVEACAVDKLSAGEEEKLLEGKEATEFRAESARIIFLSVDRPDLEYCSKEASRCMANPTAGDLLKLKKIGRYLLYRGRVAHLYRWQGLPTTFTVFVDSNWAGCPKTKRSTTGAAVGSGDCRIRSLSNTQSNIALSSAEAELYAMVHGASEGLGAQAMARGFGLQVSPPPSGGRQCRDRYCPAQGPGQNAALGGAESLDSGCATQEES